ncbi:hypothetical protein L1049_019073 [Liquidambar formosana]|uniref:Uncharacterized protein n=1 Tax=Liquidambar formosana TaxID=63359 RepID=A0AAP0RAX7_LIQFO
MGGKGRRRREKNFRAAHGEHNRLPPPPDPSAVDALPSKLRRLMTFTASFPSQPGFIKVSTDTEDKKRKGDGASEKKLRANDEIDTRTSGIKEGHDDGEGDNDGKAMAPQLTDDDEIVHNNSTNEKRKAKRKRKQVKDLRFETEMSELGIGSKRRERKKKYLEARKKKHKKAKTEENQEFPGHEKIKFGEVVEAPPKLVTIPKAFKAAQDASKERRRLQAVEAYRNRRGWTSRPGIHLSAPVTTSPLF